MGTTFLEVLLLILLVFLNLYMTIPFLISVTVMKDDLLIPHNRASLEVQQLRICLAMQGTLFDPWSRSTPRAEEQLRSCVPSTEPMCCNYRSPCTLKPVLCNQRSPRNEKLAQRSEEKSLLTTARESPAHSNQDSSQPKN